MTHDPITPRMREDICRFLDERYAEGIENARMIGNVLVVEGAAKLGVRQEVAEQHARYDALAAEAKRDFFEQTVRPYLGTAGPTGRIADQQLRLLALIHAGHRGYRREWGL